MMNGFYVNVAECMLPRPSLRDNILDRDRAESISELGILGVKCRDGDYYEEYKFGGLH